MATVKEILKNKGSEVLSIGKIATVLDAALLMNEHRVGALVIVEKRQVVGIFTERDVLHCVVGARRDPATTPIGQVMSTEVSCALPEMTLKEARTVFRDHRIRHLPVIDRNNQLVGLISIGDLNAYEANTQEATIHFLHEYLFSAGNAHSNI